MADPFRELADDFMTMMLDHAGDGPELRAGIAADPALREHLAQRQVYEALADRAWIRFGREAFERFQDLRRERQGAASNG